MGAVFITGGAGFLGRTLVPLLAEKGCRIYVLVLDESHIAATGLEGVENIHWVTGDISTPEIVFSPELREQLRNEVTHFVHLAALYHLEAKYPELYLANVAGTQNVIHFANSCTKLQAFHYASTMAVAGTYEGEFTEAMFRQGQTFPNPYALTKFEAEGCVREWRTAVRKIVYRFGILVGRSDNGAIPKIDGPYYLMHILHHNKGLRTFANRAGILPLPYSEKAHLYLVPVDVAAKAVACVLESEHRLPSKSLRVYHVMGPEGGLPIRRGLMEILETFNVRARLFALPNSRFSRRISAFLGAPPDSLFYLYSPCRFASSQLHKDFPQIRFPEFEEYCESLFEYAKNTLLVRPATGSPPKVKFPWIRRGRASDRATREVSY